MAKNTKRVSTLPKRKNKHSPLKARLAWLDANKKDNWGCNKPYTYEHRVQLVTLQWADENGIQGTVPVAPLEGFHRGAHTRVAGGLYEVVAVGTGERIPQPLPKAPPKIATMQARSAFASQDAVKAFVKIARKRGQKEVEVGYVDDGPKAKYR